MQKAAHDWSRYVVRKITAYMDILSTMSPYYDLPAHHQLFSQEEYFITYKSSTTWDPPPRPLPGAEVRNICITGNYYI
jgi:hypothetical protein